MVVAQSTFLQQCHQVGRVPVWFGSPFKEVFFPKFFLEKDLNIAKTVGGFKFSEANMEALRTLTFRV